MVFLDTTIASSVLEVSFEKPLTTDGGGAELAAPVTVTIGSDAMVVASHSSSVTVRDVDGTKGSQKSQVDDGGGGGGGGGGSAGEAVIDVQVSELGLMGICGGGGGGGVRGVGDGSTGGRWWW